MAQHVFTWANRLTILRMLCLPMYALFTIYWLRDLDHATWHWLAFGFFAFIAVTDAVDGFLARRLGQVTALGTWLDPIADKLFLGANLLLLTQPALETFQPQLPIWYSLALLAREIGILVWVVLLHVQNQHVTVRPRPSGKAATALQLLVFAGVFLRFPPTIFFALVLAATGTTGLSALLYWMDGLHQVRSHEAERNRTESAD